MTKKINTLSINLTLLFVTIIVIIVIAELICRFFLNIPDTQNDMVYPIFKPDDELQWCLKKPFHFKNINVDGEGVRKGCLIHNSANNFNILAIGDSHTFGVGVADNMSYSAQLCSVLREKYPARSINVLNAGVPGYNAIQNLGNLERFLQKKNNVDLILFGIVIDDVAPVMPVIVDNNGYLVTANPAIKASSRVNLKKYIQKVLKKHSCLVRFITSKFPGILVRVGFKKSSLDYYFANWDDVGQLAHFYDTLKTAVQLAKNNHCQLILVVFTDPNQLLFNFGFDRYQKRILLFAQSCGIPVIDLVLAYKPVYDKEGYISLFIYNDGHPNENGYRVISDYIAGFIKKNNFIK